jgi:hypothetical protein
MSMLDGITCLNGVSDVLASSPPAMSKCPRESAVPVQIPERVSDSRSGTASYLALWMLQSRQSGSVRR